MKDSTQVASALVPEVEALAGQLLEYLEQGMDLAKAQAPLLVEEILRWGVWHALILIVVAAILLLVWGGVCRAVWVLARRIDAQRAEKRRKAKEQQSGVSVLAGHPWEAWANLPWDWEGYWAGVSISGLVVGTVAAVMTVSACAQIIKITVAPRLYLIEYLRDVVG